MKKEIQKNSEEWKVFREVWDMYQRFAVPEDGENYWEELVREVNRIEKEYKTPLAKWLAYGVAKALNEIAKGEKKKQ